VRMTRADVQEVLRYCIQHPKSCLRINNIVYAPKLFLVNSILSSLQKKIERKVLSEHTIDYYLECIIGYMNEFYDLSFVDDELKIISPY